jgi:hypothetical protein
VKYFKVSWEFVLWEISYANLIMLFASVPKVKLNKKEDVQVVEDISGLEGFIQAKK